MRLLFVKLKHIGDSLLLTPTLMAARARYPTAEIWVIVRRGCEGIMAGCPAIDRLLVAAEPEQARRPHLNWWKDGQTAITLRRQRFDYAFELSDGDRGRWLCCLSGANIRCANDSMRPLNWWWRRPFNQRSHFNWRDCHRTEKDFFTVNDCLPIGTSPPPLAFDRACTESWGKAPSPGDYIVMHPGTRWWRKQWPEAKWVEVGQWLLKRVGRLIISVGPSPEETQLAASLTASLGPCAINTEGKLSWAQLAGLLYQARLFVGVDTAAMHLAAACQCPTAAIFGPSVVNQWRPWNVLHRVVTPPGALSQSPEEQLTQSVDTSAVIQACEEMLAAGRVPQ
jgi:heptosyltransferase-3